MMNYNEFMEYAAKHIQDYLPPEYGAADIRLDVVNKANEQYTGLTVRLEENGAAPVANMKMFYEQYENDRPIEDIMLDMAKIVQMEPPADIDIDMIRDYEQVKDKLFVRLSPIAGNEAIMGGSPHQIVEDMMMTYNAYVPSNDDGFLSVRITNDLLKDYGVTQEQLHQDAIASTPRIFEPKVVSMSEALMGIPEEEPAMMVVTNTQGSLGASALFCEGIMDKVAEQLKGNYFVLPSSVHEFLVVPDNGNFSRSELESMVRSANESVVEPQDKLSDEVYHYDAQDRIFERAESFEKRMQAKEANRAADRGSLLGKLQDKKEQVDRKQPVIGNNKQRQAGLAI